ncbi:MAG: ATP-binding protein [Eggerthellaceae bacterium]|nr:ATP-binding protein [Eggerthellaceae bacterium]
MRNTTSCPHCGATLNAREWTLGGKPVFAGYEQCECEGARAERAEIERLQAVAERRERERREREAIRKAGIMPRFENATHPLAPECARDMQQGRNLYIFGEVGTLKTHLASATARILVAEGCNVRFSAMWKVLDAIKAGFRDNYDPLPAYQSCKYLILDDFGKESPTDFALERMFALIDERSARMLPTAVTTQYKPGRLIERLAKNGDKDTAIAIVSRLRQDCRSIELEGRDRRLG